MSDIFKNIREHWAHFSERDIAADAPAVQFLEMKKAFSAGAISGLQLGLMAKNKDEIKEHINDIKKLASS